MLNFLNGGHGPANKLLVECLQFANGEERMQGGKEAREGGIVRLEAVRCGKEV